MQRQQLSYFGVLLVLVFTMYSFCKPFVLAVLSLLHLTSNELFLHRVKDVLPMDISAPLDFWNLITCSIFREISSYSLKVWLFELKDQKHPWPTSGWLFRKLFKEHRSLQGMIKNSLKIGIYIYICTYIHTIVVLYYYKFTYPFLYYKSASAMEYEP